MPTISVIVPVYKVEKYIHRCVDSILGQTYTDFELILVDDGSPDNCGAICDEYAAKDSRVVVIHQENGGLSAARNAGIDWAFANSDSQWLSFIDSDDWVHPEYLERLLDSAVQNNVDLSICGYVKTFEEEPEISGADLIPELWKPEKFYVEKNMNAIIACGKLYRKSCFTTVRYPIGKLHEDDFTTYKILFAQEKIVVIPAGMYFYFQNTGGIMQSPWNPRRMDGIDARREQIAFYHANGYDLAYKKAIFTLLWIIASQIKQLECGGEYRHFRTKLCRLLRKEIRTNHSILGLSIKKNYDLYEIAYPTFMKYYWLWQVVLRKLHIRK